MRSRNDSPGLTVIWTTPTNYAGFSKEEIDRWQNVEHVFNVKDPGLIEGKNILIIDDVITTGASAEACGQMLLKFGAKTISICGLAHTV
jgi:predicted amidophosphoribosyltransferase